MSKDKFNHSRMETAALSESVGIRWPGEFQPMLMHEGANGSEKIEPLPYELKPKPRKRRIVHRQSTGS